jgi:hypothetical protein
VIFSYFNRYVSGKLIVVYTPKKQFISESSH